MLRMIVAFIAVFLILFIGIPTIQHITNSEKWNIAKAAIVAAGASTFTTGVVLFLILVF